MSRLSNVKKLKEFRHAEAMAAEERRAIQRRRNPAPIAKSERNLSAKALATREKWGVTVRS